MKPAIVILSEASRALATRIAVAIAGEVLLATPDGTAPRILLPQLFAEGRPIIGICAAGILIRLVAPRLGDKHAEPPVIAVAQDGSAVVPLLGGHHGANRLAREIAALLGVVPALTTASDTRFAHGLDEPPAGYVLADIAPVKRITQALLTGSAIRLDGDAPWLAAAFYPLAADGAVSIAVSPRADAVADLVYHPLVLVAGVGCERNADPAEVIGLIAATLAEAGLAPKALAAIASIDIKADEPALHAAAKHFGVPLRVFSAAELSAETAPNPSTVVAATVGAPGVAEPAALKAGPLVVEKRKTKGATCAIAMADRPIDPTTLGRAPGRLDIVGIGPGEPAQRTASAVRALSEAEDWVGYGLYLDLVADLSHAEAQHRYPLGEEEVRVRAALELAATGRVVSLVCSGDAQIYAMASLVYELLAAEGDRAVSIAARRVPIVTHPGISAFQAASAAAGALIGHDFCCVSLSDLLTPREAILQRLNAAAEGDFVTALYNPRSQRRTDLIEETKRIFSAARPPDTPVIIASQLGRPEERVRVVRLDQFDPTEIDMLTIVLIGASTSRWVEHGGKPRAFTPRGYAKKHEGAAP
jgi:cobalt-precorrin 5A hydrolase/precorrin-3B C17-methyltransferase